MNNRSLVSLLACMVLAMLLMASSGLHAQSVIKECACDYVTIRVDRAVACKVTLVFIYPDQKFNPAIVVEPGSEVRVRCLAGTEVTVVDCMNHKNPLGADGCLRGFPAATGCCIDACLITDKSGCLLLDINPSAMKCRCI